MSKVKQQRFAVQASTNGWIVINRPAGIHPRCVFSTPIDALPHNEHDLTQWVFGLICRLWWDVTDDSGYEGAMRDAQEIARRVVQHRREGAA